MAETPAAPVKAWPRPLILVLLAVFVLADGALWLLAAYHLMGMDQRVETLEWEHELFNGLAYMTYALLLMLLGGWAWRWWVARGWIGGRPTVRFGGT